MNQNHICIQIFYKMIYLYDTIHRSSNKIVKQYVNFVTVVERLFSTVLFLSFSDAAHPLLITDEDTTATFLEGKDQIMNQSYFMCICVCVCI